MSEVAFLFAKKKYLLYRGFMNIDHKQAIAEILRMKINNQSDLSLAKRAIANKYGLPIFANSELLRVYRELILRHEIEKSSVLDRALRKRAVRTGSGVAPVAVLTMPWECPGTCAYCPRESDVPTSYLSNEPAVMRAIRCDYHPAVQVEDRLRALVANGHEPTKIELIVIGGTWSVLPEKYKYWYIKECFRAANDFSKISKFKKQIPNKFQNSKFKIQNLKSELAEEQRRNEKAKYRLIGITLETRPDYINERELLEMRTLGCTRVELGVQAIDDEILKINKRGHGVEAIARATALLRDFGFKITYHLMPGLPGSTPAKDLKMFKQLFSDERFQPDQIKFYPTVVTKGSLLYKWWKAGKYKPYTDKQLEKLIIDCKKVVPPYVRIIRLIRDIPSESIEAGNKMTNLRQIMQQKGVECHCIRCRETKEYSITNFQYSIIKYQAAHGMEYFIQAVGADGETLYGFCRLRIAGDKAMIRELHVYGDLVPMDGEKKVQHAGLGKLLMLEAEKIACENECPQISVIAGVGVRGYYRKLGYQLKKTYMVKKQNC